VSVCEHVSPKPAPRERKRRKAWLALVAFPAALNLWPLLLLVSQKALVPLGLLLAGAGSGAYQRNLAIVVSVTFAAMVMLLAQRPNEHAVAHLLGYALFLLAIPPINEAVRHHGTALLRWLAWLSVTNALMAFGLFWTDIDLSDYRGLNRVVGEDFETHRIYFESTSLIAIFTLEAHRGRVVRWACTLLVLAYAVFLAKSVFVLTLYLFNSCFPIIARGKLWVRVGCTAAMLTAIALGPLAVSALRPDVALSIGIKVLQFQTIVADTNSFWLGSGWGHVLDDVVTSEDQPYQVEMQLPMLVAQVGLVGVAIHATCLWLLIRSVSARRDVSVLRWVCYLAIGFNNPWMFVPSWYLTVVLMFRKLDHSS
jgi:hypothetical protein